MVLLDVSSLVLIEVQRKNEMLLLVRLASLKHPSSAVHTLLVERKERHSISDSFE